MPIWKSHVVVLASRGMCTAALLLGNASTTNLPPYACPDIGVASPPLLPLSCCRTPTHCSSCQILVPDQPQGAQSRRAPYHPAHCLKPKPQPLLLLPSPAVPRDRLLGGASQADQHGARGRGRVRAARKQRCLQGPILQVPWWARVCAGCASAARPSSCRTSAPLGRTPLTPWHPTPCALRCEADQVRAVASIHRGRRQVCAHPMAVQRHL
jgi:hypothetical protein